MRGEGLGCMGVTWAALDCHGLRVASAALGYLVMALAALGGGAWDVLGRLGGLGCLEMAWAALG